MFNLESTESVPVICGTSKIAFNCEMPNGDDGVYKVKYLDKEINCPLSIIGTLFEQIDGKYLKIEGEYTL